MSVYNTPANRVNQISATINPEGVRITFGESPDGSDKDVVYHSAVFMTPSTFSSVRRLFDELAASLDKPAEKPKAKRKR